MSRKKELPQKIVRLYRDGASIEAIGRRYNTGKWAVRARLEDYGVQIMSMQQRQHKKMQDNKEWVIDGWKRGLTIRDMARRLKVSPSSLTNNLRSWGYPPRTKSIKAKSIRIQQNKENIIKAFKKGTTVQDIARRHKISNCAVREWLNRWGYSTSVDRCQLDYKKIKELHDRGYSPAQIARRLGTLRGTVSKILIDKYGIRQDSPKTGVQPWRRIQKKDLKKITELTAENKSMVEMSQATGLTPDTIRKYQKIMGIRQELKGSQYTDTAKQLQNHWIKYLFMKHHSVFEISKAIGLDKTTVKQRLMNMGFRMRTSKFMQQQARKKKKKKYIRIPARDKEIMRMKR